MEQGSVPSLPKVLKYLFAVLIIVAVVGLFFGLEQSRKHRQPALPATSSTPSTLTAPRPVESGLGAQIYESVQNPVKDQLPQTNPFAKKTNPIQAVYKNPFE